MSDISEDLALLVLHAREKERWKTADIASRALDYILSLEYQIEHLHRHIQQLGEGEVPNHLGMYMCVTKCRLLSTPTQELGFDYHETEDE